MIFEGILFFFVIIFLILSNSLLHPQWVCKGLIVIGNLSENRAENLSKTHSYTRLRIQYNIQKWPHIILQYYTQVLLQQQRRYLPICVHLKQWSTRVYRHAAYASCSSSSSSSSSTSSSSADVRIYKPRNNFWMYTEDFNNETRCNGRPF